MKIISIENINIQLKQDEDTLEVSFFDGDIFEQNMIIADYNAKDILQKFNKLVKIFI